MMIAGLPYGLLSLFALVFGSMTQPTFATWISENRWYPFWKKLAASCPYRSIGSTGCCHYMGSTCNNVGVDCDRIDL